MNRRLLAAVAISAVFHAAVLFGPGRGGAAVSGEQSEAVDVMLVAQNQQPPPPPPATVEPSEEAPQADEPLLPEEFLGSGLSEPPPAAVAVDALSQFVKPEAPRPPRPEGMRTLGIPTGAQRATGAAGAKVSLVFNLEDLDRIPAARYEASPVYPPELKRAQIEGEVVLLLIVDASGRVAHAEVESSTNQGFEAAAVKAAYRWRFEPGVRNGSPVSFRMRLPMRFTIRN